VATSTLRPLSVGEILDAGIKVVLRHWRPLIKSIVLFVFPLAVLSALATASLDPDQLELLPENTSQLGQEDAAELGGLAVNGLITMLTFLVVNIACFKLVCDAWLGATPDVGRSLRFGLRRAPMALLLSLIWAIGVLLGFVALIIPGIWLSVAWALAVPVLLFERVGPLKALGRSFGLVKDRWWATFLIVIVCSLLVGVLGGVVSVLPSIVAEVAAPENALANAIAAVIGTTLSGVIIYPYYAAVLTILYFDQRVRKEGFDLQLLAEGVGVERDPDAPLPAPFEPGPVYTPEQRAAAPYWPPPPGWTPPPPEEPEPQWSSSSGWAAPSPSPESAEAPRWGPPEPEPEPAPAQDEGVSLEKKGKRADWLPPEAPRGPGGL
jgi:hypothetical protein